MPSRRSSSEKPSRTASGRPRRRAIWLGLAVVGAVAVGLALRYRSLARLPEQLRQQAFAAGITIKIGAVSVRPLATTIREVALEFPRAPGVIAIIDRATLRPAAGGLPEVAIEHVHITIGATALPQLEELTRLPLWRRLKATWGHVSVTFANRVIGHLDLDDVRVDRTARPGTSDGGSANGQAPDAPLSLVAGTVTLGERRWSDVALSLARRNQMLEIPVGDASAARAPLVVRTFPTQGGLTRWVLALAHRPATELASAVGWASGAVPSGLRLGAGLRLGGSLTFNVPDDAHQPTTGRVDLVSDGWPAPDVPDGAAWVGPTVAFGARVELARDSSPGPAGAPPTRDVDVHLERVRLAGAGNGSAPGAGRRGLADLRSAARQPPALRRARGGIGFRGRQRRLARCG